MERPFFFTDWIRLFCSIYIHNKNVWHWFINIFKTSQTFRCFFFYKRKKMSLTKKFLPKGRTKKNGNQQRMKTPTTIPSVLAAFFCRLNFINRSDIFCFEFPFIIVLLLDRPVWIRNFSFLVDDFPQDMVVSPFWRFFECWLTVLKMRLYTKTIMNMGM